MQSINRIKYQTDNSLHWRHTSDAVRVASSALSLCSSAFFSRSVMMSRIFFTWSLKCFWWACARCFACVTWLWIVWMRGRKEGRRKRKEISPAIENIKPLLQPHTCRSSIFLVTLSTSASNSWILCSHSCCSAFRRHTSSSFNSCCCSSAAMRASHSWISPSYRTQCGRTSDSLTYLCVGVQCNRRRREIVH